MLELQNEIAYQKKINPLVFYEDMPMQKIFGEDPHKIKGIFGGNRSGKTEKGAEYVNRKCLERPNQKWWVTAENFGVSVSVQQRKIWDLLPKKEIKYGHWNEITGFPNRKCLLKNGSMLTFKSYDQGVLGFASDDLDGIWDDEEPPFNIYKEQKMRLLDRDGELIITMTSTQGVTELLEDIFEDHKVIKSQYASLINKDLPRVVDKEGIRFYLFWTTENPYIAQDRVLHDIKFMTQQEITSRIYGIPINLAGKIYRFNKNVHVIPYDEVPLADCCIYQVVDPHDRKPWACIWVAVHKTGICYVIDEYPNRPFHDILSDDNTYDDYAKIFKEKEDKIYGECGKRVVKRIIDPNKSITPVQLAERQGGQSRTTIKKELYKRGYKFVPGIDAMEDGHLKVREYLYYEIKDDEIITQPKLLFTENCTNCITFHARYSRKDLETADGDVKDKVKPREKYKDFCDDTRYLCMSGPRYLTQKEFVPDVDKVY